jgi:hypothetical protein
VNTVGLLLLLLPGRLFTVDAHAETEYTVALSREALRSYVDDIGLFRRNMPGVVAVTEKEDGTYLYQTEKEIPLSSSMKSDFHIKKETLGDSLTVYRSVDPDDHNYMECSVRIRPVDIARTAIAIALRVKLSRENPSEIHWLAPILGESFISGQMKSDMNSMLEEFVEKSNAELYSKLRSTTSKE